MHILLYTKCLHLICWMILKNILMNKKELLYKCLKEQILSKKQHYKIVLLVEVVVVW